MNQLFYGDNLDVLSQHIADESVDLVYLDPPFKSNQDYNVLFQEQDGSRATAQIQAFEDTWRWDQVAALSYQKIVEDGGRVSEAMQGFRKFLHDSDILAYLAMMAPRLKELHRVLKPTGSIYLHCDPTASHYLKMLMDAVFGTGNFRNEIVWHYKSFHGNVKHYFPRKHDTLFFYTKSDSWKFKRLFSADNEDTIDFKRWNDYLVDDYKILGSNMPMQDSRFVRFYKRWVRENGREPEADDVVYEVVGQAYDTVWNIKPVDPKANDRLGYQTQKPEPLLERILESSTEKGDTVLDPFCGCGTTIAVAQRMGRPWIGIDVTQAAIVVIKKRLYDVFKEAAKYEVIGEPVDMQGAEALANENPYQFQWWALGLVGARPVDQKKGADKGIDGTLFFHDDDSEKTKQVILSVKAGHTGPAHVRDLRGVIEREQAAIGILITMQKTTKPMRTEAASGGFYRSPWTHKDHPKIQILTIEELLDGKTIDMPPLQHTNVTHKKAPRAKKGQTHRQAGLEEYPEAGELE